MGKYRKQATVQGENLTMVCPNETYQFSFSGNSTIVLNLHGKNLIGELASTSQIDWKDKTGKKIFTWVHQAI
jgi:hypothetical protein